jgi:hypothetical protein
MVGVENQPKLLKEIKKTPTNINFESGSFCNGHSIVVAKKKWEQYH